MTTYWQTMTLNCPLCHYFFEYDVQIFADCRNGITTLEILDGGEARADEHSCGEYE